MENAKLNMFGDNGSIPESNGNVKDFDTVKRNFEEAYVSGKDYGTELMDLATAFVYSVLKKCLDPQRKTAVGRCEVSENGQNPAMLDLKRGIASDVRILDNTRDNANKATRSTLDKDGNPITEVKDKNAEAALASLLKDALSDGIDLVQTASFAILEQAIEHADGIGWLDRHYTVRRLSKRVYIQETDSAAYKDVEITPAQEVFRTVRRAVQDSRAIQTDPRNGYTYIEDLTVDGVDVIYYRLQKYADLGGYNVDGNYTADIQAMHDYNDIIESLELTKRQEQVLRLRVQGKGKKAIATYLGVTQHAIAKTMQQVQKKAIAIGLKPKN